MRVNINGKIYSKDDACISVYDSGFLYGDGVFEGICFSNKKIFKLTEHIVRLYESAQTILLTIPKKQQELIEEVKKTVRESTLADGYIRLIVTRGKGNLGLNPFVCKNPQIIIIVDQLALYPDSLYEKGLTLITSASPRNFAEALSPRVKHMNYLNNIMAQADAVNAGADEALLLNTAGYVSECSGDNIFIVKDNVLYTPNTSSGILKGITRDLVIELAQKNGLDMHVVLMSRHDIYNADECFLTGTAAKVVPAVKLDWRIIGTGKPGPITKRFIEQFNALVKTAGEPV